MRRILILGNEYPRKERLEKKDTFFHEKRTVKQNMADISVDFVDVESKGK